MRHTQFFRFSPFLYLYTWYICFSHKEYYRARVFYIYVFRIRNTIGHVFYIYIYICFSHKKYYRARVLLVLAYIEEGIEAIMIIFLD